MNNVERWTRKMLLCARHAEEAQQEKRFTETLDWIELAMVCLEKASQEAERDERDG